jgi:ABC-2 type transport system ATP-binding protein
LLVLGPNGAGKSTLMKILTTYITADEGTATVNGQDVNTKAVQLSIGLQSTIRCGCMFVNI